MDEVTRAVIELLTPIISALAVALGGWLLSKMPGPLRDVMTANVHAKDVVALVGAMQRRALAEIADHRTPPPTPAQLIAYMERIKPELLEKMQVAPEALTTMAAAAIATATPQPPVDVLLVPR